MRQRNRKTTRGSDIPVPCFSDRSGELTIHDRYNLFSTPIFVVCEPYLAKPYYYRWFGRCQDDGSAANAELHSILEVVHEWGAMTGARNRHLIWLSGQTWDCVTGSDRSMAVALSEHAPLLWVDAPASPVTRSVSGYTQMLAHTQPRIHRLSDRITRLTTVALPGMTRPGVRSTTPRMVRAQIKWAMRQLQIEPAAVIMGYLGDLLGGWGDGVVNVLYGTDDWVAGAQLTGMSVRNLLVREGRALANADVIITVTPQLAERWAGLGSSAVVIPNGCWPDNGEAPPPLPSALASLPRPSVGYIGYLGHRVDMNILMSIAETEFSLLLVGERDLRWEPLRFQQLIAQPNVTYVGPAPSSEVRAYMSGIDVGITPYSFSQFNLASFPLKTLEYLGSGIPVVSSGLPASHWLRKDLSEKLPDTAADQVLALADTPAEFVSTIRKLLGDGTDPSNIHAKSCISFAECHSWPQRAATFAAALGLGARADS